MTVELPPVLLISDGRGDRERLLAIAAAAWRGGIRALQVREPGMDSDTLCRTLRELRRWFAPPAGVLLVNRRADLVGQGLADGVQLGADAMPLPLVRQVTGPGRLLGYSAHAVAEAVGAAAAGADFVLLAPVFATASKPGIPPLGLPVLKDCVRRCPAPVFALGGIDAAQAVQVRAVGAAGVACIGAVFAAAAPQAAADALVRAMAAG